MRLALTALAVSFAVLAAPVGAQEPDVERARSDANVAAAELAAAQSQLALLEREVATHARQVASIEGRVSQLRRAVQDHAVDLFVRGGTDPSGADLLLQGEDPDSALRAGALARSVTSEVAEVLAERRRAAEDLASSAGRLAELEGRRAAAVALLRERTTAASAELERQERLAAERRAAQQEAARAAAGPGADATDQQGAAPPQGGEQGPALDDGGPSGFRCPVDGPLAFADDWGQPRSGGRRHEGTDLLSPRGTPVVASVAGTVETHQSSLGGVSYYLLGEDGNTYFGTHLHSLSGPSGPVPAGTVLGYVGNSGNARGGPTHLHFEIRPGGGAAVNPHPALAASC